MRAFLLAFPLSILTLFPSFGNAGERPRQIAVSDSEKFQWTSPNNGTYRGYLLHLSEIAGRQDFAAIADTLRHQLDIVESVGLSPRVLKFFHTVPIVADEMACLDLLDLKDPSKGLAHACYGPVAPEVSQHTSYPKPNRVFSVWDSETGQWTNPDAVALSADTRHGVVKVRPLPLSAQAPVVLHELLHAYHAQMMPQGFKTPGVLLHYNLAKSKQLYPADAYLLTNEREFFAVTASVFLYGRDAKEPFTRSNLKQKQPDYYKYLVWLFTFDPDRAPSASPVASTY